jgi:hypothetical protein
MGTAPRMGFVCPPWQRPPVESPCSLKRFTMPAPWDKRYCWATQYLSFRTNWPGEDRSWGRNKDGGNWIPYPFLPTPPNTSQDTTSVLWLDPEEVVKDILRSVSSTIREPG